MFACSRAVLLLATCVLLIPRTAADPCPANAAPFTLPSQITEAEQVKHSTLFSVQHYSTYKVISFANTLLFKSGWPDASMRGQPIPDLVLYKCGTERPSTAFTGVTDGSIFFSIPIERAALAFSGVLHFFELLSATAQINAIDMTYVSSPCQQLLEMCNPNIHAPSWHEAWDEIANDSTAVFTNSFGPGATNSSRDVPFDVYSEGGILRRAEWIRFVALFFNLEAKAGRIFARIEADYEALKEEALRLRDEHTSAVPFVAWAARVPGCVTSACYDMYRLIVSRVIRRITQEAGGRLLTVSDLGPNCTAYRNSDGTQVYDCIGTPEGSRHFRELLAGADVIIDESPVDGPYVLNDFVSNFGADPANFRAMQAEAVYRMDWSEQMDAQPQELLSDMMHAIWGASFQGPCQYKYLRSLYQAPPEPLDHSDCPMYDPMGTHDCEAIHDYDHEVHRCALVTTSSSSSESSTSSITSSIASSSTSSRQPEASSGNTMMVLAPCAFASVFCFHLFCYGRAA